MKIIILFAGILLEGYATAQTNTDSPYNIIPPSSESYYKSKFGDTHINDFRGEPIVNIPLLSLKYGDIPFELDLRYLKAGVKVNEISNTTGINWILNTGGIITRTINDIADEKVSRNLFSQLPNITLNNPQNWGAYVIQSSYDHEVDIFNFTIGGYSGSFFLDQNFQPVILTKDNNCKVEVIGTFSQDYSFKITTTDGIVYLFGGTGFTEQTINRDDPENAGVTSFYLKNISSSKTNQTINYEYDSLTTRTIGTGVQESYNSDIPFIVEPDCGGHPLPSTSTEEKISILKILNPKRLKRIILDNDVIEMGYSSDYILYNKLSEINLYNNSILKRKYQLEYLDKKNINNKLQRYFLTEVKYYEAKSDNLYLRENYRLEYDMPLEIPDRLSKSIDYLGYYNGVISMTNTLIPNINLFDGTDKQIYNHLADRRPNFEFAKYGALKSITYPTTGKTLFEYESLPKKGIVENQFELNIDLINQADQKILLPSDYTSGALKISFDINSSDPTNGLWKMKSQFQILDESNNILYTKTLNIPKGVPGFIEEIVTGIELNKKHKFLLKINDNTCLSCTGKATVIYIVGWKQEHDVGVRLKKQYDVSENQITNFKRIYYTDLENISNIDKTTYNFIPNFKSYFAIQSSIPHSQTSSDCGIGTYGGSLSVVENLKSTPFLNSIEKRELFLLPNGTERQSYFNLEDPMYENITVSFGGENFEKGGEQKYYFVDPRTTVDINLFSPEFQDLSPNDFKGTDQMLSVLKESVSNKLHRYDSYPNLDGKLLEHKTFFIDNGNIKYTNYIENKYIFNKLINIYNVIGGDVYPALSGYPYNIINKVITSYGLVTTEALLHETISTDISDPNSVDKKIVVKVQNFYDNPSNQVTKQKISFPDNSITETTYKYAHEKNNPYLIGKNMIGVPLETTVVKKADSTAIGKLLSKSEMIYPMSQSEADTKTAGLALPYEVRSTDLLGINSLEATYDKYDLKGNILQYTTKDGIPTSIIWGYNKTQPIAKIVGATYSVVSSIAADIVTASDTDAGAAANNDETSFLLALDLFRKDSRLIDYQITTYTYDPLIGVRSITPPSGIREVYLYDNANRLKEIREDNAGGKILKEFKYNYKH